LLDTAQHTIKFPTAQDQTKRSSQKRPTARHFWWRDGDGDIGGDTQTESDKTAGTGGTGYEADNLATTDEIYVRP